MGGLTGLPSGWQTPPALIALAALIIAALGFAAAYLLQCRRIRRLSEQIEDFLARGGQPLAFSVREDRLAPLHNAAAELENRLLLARERERAECRRAGDLTADISHQLKTPLASLRLFCEMDECPHMCDQLSQIERMERLIYSLLRLERLCADGYEFAFAECDVGGIVREAWRGVDSVYPGRTLEVTGEASARCDRKWLCEAFANLLKNSCEHMPIGGTISVRIEQTPSALYCTVEDEGGGVDARDIPHLFERFYRARGRETQGTGIGLAIVRAIIRRHHGDIYAENTARGLRMNISIPIYSGLVKP